MAKITDKTKKAIMKWEDKNLINYDGYVLKGKKGSIINDMQSRGYDAMRISPQTTTKYGLKYRKVFGASVSPMYSRGLDRNKKYYPKVEWHLQGYIKAGKITGSRMFPGLTGQFNKTELKSKLMMR